jgi:UDP-N-acetylmuramyl tripeptide synthase
LASVIALGIPAESATKSLAGLHSPWGRYESVFIDGREVILALGKNPASLAELVRIGADSEIDAVVVGVNDAIADGRDASWYWDVDLWPLLANRTVVLAGTRRSDMALRLKYAAAARGIGDWSATASFDDPADAVAKLVAKSRSGARILVVATYTAMLGLRADLASRHLVAPVPT